MCGIVGNSCTKELKYINIIIEGNGYILGNNVENDSLVFLTSEELVAALLNLLQENKSE